jgi:hypothetical protein
MIYMRTQIEYFERGELLHLSKNLERFCVKIGFKIQVEVEISEAAWYVRLEVELQSYAWLAESPSWGLRYYLIGACVITSLAL